MSDLQLGSMVYYVAKSNMEADKTVVIRPAIVTALNPEGTFVNLVVFVDGSNDQRYFSGMECSVRTAWRTHVEFKEDDVMPHTCLLPSALMGKV